MPTPHTLKLLHLPTHTVTAHTITVSEALHPVNGNRIWNTQFSFNEEVIESKGVYYLYEAINHIREIVEPKGYRVLARCADHDAVSTGIQADMSAGTMVYKLKEIDAEGRYVSYHVLTESDIQEVVTLEEQKKNTASYYQSMNNKNNSKPPKTKQAWWKKLFGIE